MSEPRDDAPEAIAIIGMAGRFPGAPDVAAFWGNLQRGVESVRFFSRDELLAAGVDPADLDDPRYVPARAPLDDLDRFDASFFGMTPREAEITDPQHRIFLECAALALESAALDPTRFPGAIAVYAGAGPEGYRLHHLAPNPSLAAAVSPVQALLGNDKDYLATRVSYKLNLRGPSLTVQTACSTSLVATQLAVQSLLTYQCDVALAGGVSITFPIGHGYLHQPGSLLSPDGHCRAFDVEAAGTIAGDGVGVVVLKRLSEALAAGDRIHAVILGAAVNNDGSAKVGFTAPGVDGQAEVIAAAHAFAEVDPRSIGYVEAHGTGTTIGDPIEIAALTQAFRRGTDAVGFCALGSLKSNVGHLNAAAGVASLIKATLAIDHGLIPPSLHVTTPSPALDLERSPFFVNTALRRWDEGERPRRAGVSSFGFGGTNAHVVLEQAPPRAASSPSRGPQLLVLSARSSASLDAGAARLAAHLGAHPELSLADAAFTLQIGRRVFSERLAAVVHSVEDAASVLASPGSARVLCGRAAEGRSLVFAFPGQGAHHAGMARGLLDAEPVFRATIERASAQIQACLGFDLVRFLAEGADPSSLDRTALAQPVLFAIEHALASLWIAWGIRPGAMIGHSLGEYVAACIAGVFSFEAGLDLVIARGAAMERSPEGAMLAVPLAEDALAPLLGDALALAAVNGPGATVASGSVAAIEALEARLAARGVEGKRLPGRRAYHSALIDPALDPLRVAVEAMELRPPGIPYLSSLTGAWITPEQATDPGYWIEHARRTVRFGAGLDTLFAGVPRIVLEVGPGRTLSALVARHRGDRDDALVLASLPAASGRSEPHAHVVETLGRLWVEGIDVDFPALHRGETRHRVELPGYAFERTRYWIDPPRAARAEPEPADLTAALEEAERAIDQACAIQPMSAYPGLETLLDALCSASVLGYLRDAGIDVRPGSAIERGALQAKLGILPAFARLHRAMIGMLEEDGIIEAEGAAVRFTDRASSLPSPAILRAEALARYPSFAGLVDFLDHCARHYDQALRGSIPAISVLYPGGSGALVEGFGARTAEHRSERVYLELCREAVLGILGQRPGKRARVLEVGGGQGGLTWVLAPALQGHDVDYHFTDVGRVFVDDARREAVSRGLRGQMTFGVLDIGKDPAEQGYGDQRFDLVVAFNVVHATPDLGAAVRNLASLLAPGGVMAWVEVTSVRRWDTLTWGLAEGWWTFDDDLRKDSPLLPLGAWEGLLRAEGFSRVTAFPRGDEERVRRDHGLILASGAAPSPADQSIRQPFSTPALLDAPRHPRPALRAPYVAPRTALEGQIASLCQEIFGVERVGVHDDFIELGADSLMTLRLTDRLRRELGIEVPAHAAFRGSTVERMARALEGAPDIAPSSPLVPIQPGGARPPLFFVHPAAGVVFPYFELARQLGPEQPFYGLQALGLDGEAEPDQTIDAMATHYVEAIRTVQPRGPYHLGGFSFGCLVAFEMAQQLRLAGQEVALLALIDEPAPVHGHRPSAVVMSKLLVTGMAKTIWPHLNDYLHLVKASSPAVAPGHGAGGAAKGIKGALEAIGNLRPDAEMFTSLLARFTMANFIPPEARLLALRQPAVGPMFQLFLIHLRETLAYVPRAYPHRVVVFRATRIGGKFADDPTMGWGVLAAGGVEVHDLPGEHLTIIRKPHVEVLARKLTTCLREAQGPLRGGARPG